MDVACSIDCPATATHLSLNSIVVPESIVCVGNERVPSLPCARNEVPENTWHGRSALMPIVDHDTATLSPFITSRGCAIMVATGGSTVGVEVGVGNCDGVCPNGGA